MRAELGVALINVERRLTTPSEASERESELMRSARRRQRTYRERERRLGITKRSLAPCIRALGKLASNSRAEEKRETHCFARAFTLRS